MNAIIMTNNNQVVEAHYKKPQILERISARANLYPHTITSENLKDHTHALKEAHVIFSTWGMPPLTQQEIEEYLPNLKAVFYGAGSVQSFARPFLNKGIKVMSAWAANAIPVAEYTLATIILASKNFFKGAALYKEQSYQQARALCSSYPGLYDITVSVLGAGMIGRHLIKLLKPFKIKTIVYDPFLSDEMAIELGVTKVSTLDQAFSLGFIISNHIANLPTTQKIITAEHFALMKDNGIFINTGRGAQLDEDGLIDALKAKPERMAILDVTQVEPLPRDNPMLTMENVILTPHIAGSMGDEITRMMEYAVVEFENFVDGLPMNYCISISDLETMA